jgi:hypothetical protein
MSALEELNFVLHVWSYQVAPGEDMEGPGDWSSTGDGRRPTGRVVGIIRRWETQLTTQLDGLPAYSAHAQCMLPDQVSICPGRHNKHVVQRLAVPWLAWLCRVWR